MASAIHFPGVESRSEPRNFIDESAKKDGDRLYVSSVVMEAG